MRREEVAPRRRGEESTTTKKKRRGGEGLCTARDRARGQGSWPLAQGLCLAAC